MDIEKQIIKPAYIALLLAIAAAGGCVQQASKPTTELRSPNEAPLPPPAVSMPLDVSLHRKALNELLADAQGDDMHLRANAIEALQEAGVPEAGETAMRGLLDPEPLVRFVSCMAIGQLRFDEAHDRLLRMFENEPNTVKVGVIFALHRLGDTRYSHQLESLARDADPEVRGKTALALGFLGEPSAIVILHPMRHDTEESVRLQASTSLWLLGNEQGLDDLAGYAVSGYPDDLILATLGLAGPKNPRVSQHIRANLVSDYPEVELAAARALGELGSDEGYAIAMKGAESSDSIQRSLAALALGAIGRSDAQPELGKLLDDSTPAVRLSAATALLELRQQ